MSKRTIQRRLNESGLYGRIAAHKPFVSKKNVLARIRFAKEHVDWTLEQWKNVLWSDESKFNMINTDGIRYVRRPSNMRFNPRYTVGSVKHNGGNIMVWGCFSFSEKGPLCHVEGRMDYVKYREIMSEVMLPHARENMPAGWIYQQDNDPKHKAKGVMNWFQDNSVSLLEWPAQSPDLNPIEHLWGEVERKLMGRKFQKPDDLYAAVQQEWLALPNSVLETLVRSMPRRCKAVIDAKGFPTMY